ncbi:MAG: helix-turn-helix domain-containing protein [Catenulisporales bacterium]|jgi:predicted XRE-type DNA-binding protein|nr:helix-turn-helix domain-containing protein [Catenulisporales bacterium]
MTGHSRWQTAKARRRAIDPGIDDPARLAAAHAAVHAYEIGFHLAEMRNAESVSQAYIAAQLGITVDEVARMEEGDVAMMRVDRIAAYIAALGGHLRLVADIGATSTKLLDYTEPLSGDTRDVA